MSEPTRLPPSGSGANPPIGARALNSTANALAGRLQVGMQVELMPARSITPELIETRLRPVGGTAGWTSSVRAQLTTALPANALQATATERPGSGALPTLRAEVVATSPTLVLRLVSAADRPMPMPMPGQPAVSGAGSREWLGQQFRQHWPESRPVAATLDRIAVQLADEIAGNPITAPTSATNTETNGSLQLQRAITTLIGQLATVTELTDPEQLAVAVRRSGVWLESLLAQAAIDPAQSNGLRLDLKAQLLTLAQRLRVQGAHPPSLPPPGLPTAGRRPDMSAPQLGPPQTGAPPTPVDAPAAPRSVTTPEPVQPVTTEDRPTEAAHRATQDNQRTASLARDVEGMLKQVVTKQLQSLDSTAGQTQWLLELPFRTPSGLQALDADIRREQAREDKKHDVWSMRLRLDLPKLGPLNIVLTLRDERLNASLQAGYPEGAEQIKQHLGDLRARLEAREIQVASLHAGHRPLERPPPPFDDPLVREQA